MLRKLRLLTAGESHGPKMTAILEGMPAGLVIDRDAIQFQLARRQKGFGAGARMRLEKDTLRFSGGIALGQTTGGPLAMEVENRDWKNWDKRDIQAMVKPRPGHADLTGAVKYGHRDLRLSLERASARETVTRVAAGSICRLFLAQLGITLGGYVTQIGGIHLEPAQTADASFYKDRFSLALNDDLCCPDPDASLKMRGAIKQCMKAKDTLGGVLEVVALGLPLGLGSYVQADRRLDARLAMAMMSIPAMKGVEIGSAFDNSGLRGTQVHDAIHVDASGRIHRKTNKSGGLEGGVTTGAPLLVRVAMKPISTTLTPRPTVDLATGEASETRYERSDFCAVPRAVPIAEAMMALVLADSILEKVGGDCMGDVVKTFTSLRRAHVEDLPMNNRPWQLNYDV